MDESCGKYLPSVYILLMDDVALPGSGKVSCCELARFHWSSRRAEKLRKWPQKLVTFSRMDTMYPVTP